MTIDFSCAIGPWAFRRLPVTTATDARRELKREGIDLAVVSSLPAVLYKNPQEGNLGLAAEVGKRSRVWVPFAVLNPMFPGWEEDLRYCAEGLEMKGLRLYPNYHGYQLRRREARALVRAATELGWPVQVSVRLEDERYHHWGWQVKPTPVAHIAKLAADLPEATVILSGGSYADIRAFFEAVGDRENTCAELGWLKSPLEAVKTCVGEFGAERLLLGTNYPLMVPFCATEKVTRADIPAAAERAIMGGNAARILGLPYP